MQLTSNLESSPLPPSTTLGAICMRCCSLEHFAANKTKFLLHVATTLLLLLPLLLPDELSHVINSVNLWAWQGLVKVALHLQLHLLLSLLLLLLHFNCNIRDTTRRSFK